MISTAEANRLLHLPKIAIDGSVRVNLSLEKTRVKLISEDADEFEFLFQYTRTTKVSFLRISCHHQESSGPVGLLRVCYGKGHTNPVDPSFAPELAPYAGRVFSIEEAHAHLYVEGYPPLDWAKPVLESGFSIPALNDLTDLETVVFEFCSQMNVRSTINIEKPIL